MANNSRTKTSKSNTLQKYLQAELQEYLGGPRKYDDSSTEEFTNRDNSDNDGSTEKRDKFLKTKDKNSGNDSMKTPIKNNGNKAPTPPEYLFNKNPKGFYERKGD